ncbi:hypothetical protein [Mucilaginibacter kameinonensis]|uniref:hypothetical protein n=1 Tax=Mucilaginibacter kameinonensis TaxID=452286 RepID=UPI0013CE863C|nr:hypothetical protein [Mucilaginibacter kameinonensis]
MTTFYIILKITALLAVIIVSITGPKKKKVSPKTEMSGFAVNPNGYLEHFKKSPEYPQPVE